MGVVPTIGVGFRSGLDVGSGEDEKRIGGMSVLESIDGALDEVGATLEILGDGRLPTPVRSLKRERSAGHAASDDSAALLGLRREFLRIYREVPEVSSERCGWRMHLRDLVR